MRRCRIFPRGTISDDSFISSMFFARFQYGEVFVLRIEKDRIDDFRLRMRLQSELRKNIFSYYPEVFFVGHKFVLSTTAPGVKNKNITLEEFNFRFGEPFVLDFTENSDIKTERVKMKVLSDYLYTLLRYQGYKQRDMWINQRGNAVVIKMKTPEFISKDEDIELTDNFSICYLFWETFIRREYTFSIEKFCGRYHLSVIAGYNKKHQRKYPVASYVVSVLKKKMKKTNKEISNILSEFFQVCKCSYQEKVPVMNTIGRVSLFNRDKASEDKINKLRKFQGMTFESKVHHLESLEIAREDFCSPGNCDLIKIVYAIVGEKEDMRVQKNKWYFLRHVKLDFRHGSGLSKRSMRLLNRTWITYHTSKEPMAHKMLSISDLLQYRFRFLELLGDSAGPNSNILRYCFNNHRTLLCIESTLSSFQYTEMMKSRQRNFELVDFRHNRLEYSSGSNFLKWSFEGLLSKYSKQRNLNVWRKMLVIHGKEHVKDTHRMIATMLETSGLPSSSVLKVMEMDEENFMLCQRQKDRERLFSQFLRSTVIELGKGKPDLLLFVMTDYSCDFYEEAVRLCLHYGLLLQGVRGETIRKVQLRDGQGGLKSLCARLVAQIMGKFGYFLWNIRPLEKKEKKVEEKEEIEEKEESVIEKKKEEIILNVGIYSRDRFCSNGRQMLYSVVCSCHHPRHIFTRRSFFVGTVVEEDEVRDVMGEDKGRMREGQVRTIMQRMLVSFIRSFEKFLGDDGPPIDILMVYRYQTTLLAPSSLPWEMSSVERVLSKRKNLRFAWVNVRGRPNVQFFGEGGASMTSSSYDGYERYKRGGWKEEEEVEEEAEELRNVRPGTVVTGRKGRGVRKKKFFVISPFYYGAVGSSLSLGYGLGGYTEKAIKSEKTKYEGTERDQFETVRVSQFEIIKSTIDEDTGKTEDWIEEYSFKLCFLYYNENRMTGCPGVLRCAMDLYHKMLQVVVSWEEEGGQEIPENVDMRERNMTDMRLKLPFMVIKRYEQGQRKKEFQRMKATSFDASLHLVVEILFHKSLRTKFFEL